MATIKRIGRAKAFANWRNSNTAAIASFMQAVLRGPDTADAKVTEMTPVGRKLDALDSIIKGVAPLNAALDYCGRMATQLALRLAKEKRLALYDRAVSALAPVIKLGELAEAQVASLRTKLHGRAVYWRDQCYGNAFALADTSFARPRWTSRASWISASDRKRLRRQRNTSPTPLRCAPVSWVFSWRSGNMC